MISPNEKEKIIRRMGDLMIKRPSGLRVYFDVKIEELSDEFIKNALLEMLKNYWMIDDKEIILTVEIVKLLLLFDTPEERLSISKRAYNYAKRICRKRNLFD